MDQLTTIVDVVKLSNMKARRLVKQRVEVHGQAFADLAIWQLPEPLPGSEHLFKYRLAYVVDGVCVLRYDNESGKGDHRHLGRKELAYAFSNPRRLMADFFDDIRRYNHEHLDD